MKPKLKRLLKPAHDFMQKAKTVFKPGIVAYRGNKRENTKWALISYLQDAINMKDSSTRMFWNSNWWECREIARILSGLGYNVEAIASSDRLTLPPRQYDLIIDIARNLQRLAPYQKKSCVKLLLLTGSHHLWAIESELKRISEFEKKHGTLYTPRYAEFPLFALNKSLEIADACMLIGNDVTLNTYPDSARAKITKIPATASLSTHVKNYSSRTNNFLYFNSPRNVGKGLDLVLDVFTRHPEWILHCVGNVESERDFMLAYPDLSSHRNIVMHGHMVPSSFSFEAIVDLCDCFIAPSCSEGTSTSCLTCLQCGLYPILTQNTGVDLPEGVGIWISDWTEAAVERAVLEFQEKSEVEIAREAEIAHQSISRRHNREFFSQCVRDFITEAVSRQMQSLGGQVQQILMRMGGGRTSLPLFLDN